MPTSWYVEIYSDDKIESHQSFAAYEDAFEAVKSIVDGGKLARFIAPVDATSEQLGSFHRLGMVERI
jgi:hypothetical protein